MKILLIISYSSALELDKTVKNAENAFRLYGILVPDVRKHYILMIQTLSKVGDQDHSLGKGWSNDE